MNNNQKGLLYEVQIRDFIISNINNIAYLWNDVPENILLKYNIIGSHNQHRINRKLNKENPIQDTGIDIIQIDNEDNCCLIQCKNGYKNGITMNDLAGFMCWMAHLDTLTGYVYYTNKLSHNIQSLPENSRIQYIKQSFNDSIDNINNINNSVVIEPYSYQLDAKNNFDIHFRNNNRGILSMPCGTGKTYTSYLISQNYKQIIIISPLKQFTQQNLEKYLEYGYSYNTKLIDSDGDRDIDSVKEFINNNNKFLLSSTFYSIDVIYQCLELFDNPLFIIDEFHNLTKTNMSNENDEFYKILNSNHRILFMSATPRIYEMEDTDIDLQYIYGDVVYNMTFSDAINNKYITDYRIWLPSISEDNTLLYDEIANEIDISCISETLKAKCIFLYSCILNNGSKKCIIYCKNINETKQMTNLIIKLNEFYCIDIEINSIISNTSKINRTKRLLQFSNSNKIQLLFSVRILDECIDIPKCDSIYITYPSQSKIRTIQRLSRCIRINKENPFKIGNIYIWCNEYDKIIQTLSGIKEYDTLFKDKININNTDFFNTCESVSLDNDKTTISNYVVGIKEYRLLNWNEKLHNVIEFITENDKLPMKNDNKMLYKWIGRQKKNYRDKTESMKITEIYDIWTEFYENNIELFVDYTKIWKNKLQELETYIIDNNALPTKIANVKLNTWIYTQKHNYKKRAQIMQNQDIYDIWTETIETYSNVFMNTYFITIWYNKFQELIEFVNEYNKLPTKNSSNKSLGIWIGTQRKNYKKHIDCMKYQEIYDKFTIFMTEHPNLFMTNAEKWSKQYIELTEYISTYNELPKPTTSKKLNSWMDSQKNRYKYKTDNMKIKESYDLWTELIQKYPELFIN
jgi:superfamily II DNA or RNA helicase